MSELKVSLAEKRYKDPSDMKEEVSHIPSQIEHLMDKKEWHPDPNDFPTKQWQTPRTVLSD